MPKFDENDPIYIHNATAGNFLRTDSHGGIEDSGIPSATIDFDKLYYMHLSNDVGLVDEGIAVPISGVTLITGGTGIADLTLDAPVPGCRCEIRIDSIASGTVVVTCETGVTLDGTNDIATFNAAADALILGYKSATEWQIIQNEGSVALSATAG